MTGVRFVNKNGIYGFQIQQGVLLPHGGIDNDTIQWLDIDVQPKVPIGLKRNKVYLDNIDIKDNNAVLIGIKFEVAGGDAIAIALHFTKFYFSFNEVIKSGNVRYLGDIGWRSEKDMNRR